VPVSIPSLRRGQVLPCPGKEDGIAYSDFTLQEVAQRFQLVLEEQHNLFGAVPEVIPGDFLCAFLAENVPLALALSTEKARSELMIAPVLVEVRKLAHRQISLFSGADFSVDATQGLTGVCDFLISQSREQLFICAPVVIIVEAKNENFKAGMGQCSATMMAAQCFNAREGTGLTTIYGAVTTGNVWKFLQLKGHTLFIDLPEYHIGRVGKILGILLTMVGHHPGASAQPV
jgi:hypothetical protein